MTMVRRSKTRIRTRFSPDIHAMNRFMPILVRMLTWAGIRTGVDYMARRNEDRAENSELGRKQARETNRRMRQAVRILRRFVRF